MPDAAHLVHLVRHAEVHNPDQVNYAALPGFALSDVGWSQAAAAGRHLAHRPVVAVATSPLLRARQTAAVVASPHGVRVAADARLAEWRLADVWAGVPWAAIDAGQLAAYRQHPHDLPFSPESLAELADRMAAAILDLGAANAGGDVVAVSHQDPVQAGRLRLSGRDPSMQHDDKPDHAAVITLAPGDPWQELEHWAPAS